jgi:hypothetical protein
MDNLNLVLTFKLAGDAGVHVRGAARIKVDGRGGLMLYDTQGDGAETIDLRTLQSFCIHQVTGARAEVPPSVVM